MFKIAIGTQANEQEVPKLSKEQQRKQREELINREYNDLHSICLECKHSFVQTYISKPGSSQESLEKCMGLTCKLKWEIFGVAVGGGRLYMSDMLECDEGTWRRKVLTCLDFESKNKKKEVSSCAIG